MRNSRVKQEMERLRQRVNNIAKDYLEDIYRIIKRAISKYPDDWDKELERLEDTIYRSLEEVYTDTSYTVKRTYGKTLNFDIKNIKDLTFSKDGKTLEQRCEYYWTIAEAKIIAKKNDNDILLYLLNRFAIIIATEDRNVEEVVKKNKKPISQSDNLYVIQVIEGCGCEGCSLYNGEYPEDEDVPWPPYHPNCNGEAHYDVTDDLDDINDLDLNDEDE